MFDFQYLVCAFAGGIFGAALGGMPAFIICGLSVAIGAAINLATGDPTFLNTVSWGPFLAPNVAFAGGVAASAYAHWRGKTNSGQDIAESLMGLNAPDVLLVGGIFGALGYAVKTVLDLVPNVGGMAWTNTTAMTIVISTIAARLLFGKSGIFGKVRKGASRWIPNEVAAWLPWQSKPLQLIVIAIGTSLPLAYIISKQPALLGLGFGLTCVALIFLRVGAKAPVIFHIALAAEAATAASGNIWWGLTFGLLAAFLGEFFSCVFLIHGDTYIDPPSASLAVLFALLAGLAAAGVFRVSGVAAILVATAVALGGYALLTAIRRSGGKPAETAELDSQPAG